MSSIVCCDGGVFRFYPPTSANPEWTIETLLETPASDATLIDFDGDGKDELLVLSPFHGDTVLIYREKDGKYELDYEYPEKIEFLHAIWSGEVLRQISLPCVSTPAGIFLVFRTLLNCLDCIILWN